MTFEGRENVESESIEMLKPTCAFKWVKYWAGREYKKRLEQRFVNEKGEERWREVPTFLEEKSNN
jgi:hypothetical protein